MNWCIKYRFAWEQDITEIMGPEGQATTVVWNQRRIHKVPRITPYMDKHFFNGFIFLSMFGSPFKKGTALATKGMAVKR
jgi:hypothetical protein